MGCVLVVDLRQVLRRLADARVVLVVVVGAGADDVLGGASGAAAVNHPVGLDGRGVVEAVVVGGRVPRHRPRVVVVVVVGGAAVAKWRRHLLRAVEVVLAGRRRRRVELLLQRRRRHVDVVGDVGPVVADVVGERTGTEAARAGAATGRRVSAELHRLSVFRIL